MPLILHPNGSKLLSTDLGLAASTDCCCGGCNLSSVNQATLTLFGGNDFTCEDTSLGFTTVTDYTYSNLNNVPFITSNLLLVGGVLRATFALGTLGSIADPGIEILTSLPPTGRYRHYVYRILTQVKCFEPPDVVQTSLCLTGTTAIPANNDDYLKFFIQSYFVGSHIVDLGMRAEWTRIENECVVVPSGQSILGLPIEFSTYNEPTTYCPHTVGGPTTEYRWGPTATGTLVLDSV